MDRNAFLLTIPTFLRDLAGNDLLLRKIDTRMGHLGENRQLTGLVWTKRVQNVEFVGVRKCQILRNWGKQKSGVSVLKSSDSQSQQFERILDAGEGRRDFLDTRKKFFMVKVARHWKKVVQRSCGS